MLFSRNKKFFNIAKIPQLDLNSGPKEIDIGFLVREEHLNAFADIFEKVIYDNWEALKSYDRVIIKGDKSIGALSEGMSKAGSVIQLLKISRILAEELYNSKNNKVTLLFIGEVGSKELIAKLDNPYFAFGNEQSN